MLDFNDNKTQSSSNESYDGLKRLPKSCSVTTQLEKDLLDGVFVNPSTKQASQISISRANQQRRVMQDFEIPGHRHSDILDESRNKGLTETKIDDIDAHESQKVSTEASLCLQTMDLNSRFRRRRFHVSEI